MKYMGSKNRIAKHLLPIMLEKRGNRTWVEPFVGGANMIDKVEGKRIGADLNGYLIKALLLVQNNIQLIPKNNVEYTEDMFIAAKEGDLSNPIDCFAMFQYTFGSIFKGSWARNKRGTDYVRECVKNVITQSKNLQGVQFKAKGYQDLEIPPKSLIYCDPPYENTAKYKTGDFNHKEFWNWCREKVKEGHIVFVSEYNAPDDFECVWTGEVKSTLGNNDKSAIEKLFTLTI